jgi:hypothetical protein
MRIRNPAYMYRCSYDTRFCQRMLNDLGHKIKRSKERLLLTQMEQAAANGRFLQFFYYIVPVSVIYRFADPHHLNTDPDSAPSTFVATIVAISLRRLCRHLLGKSYLLSLVYRPSRALF